MRHLISGLACAIAGAAMAALAAAPSPAAFRNSRRFILFLPLLRDRLAPADAAPSCCCRAWPSGFAKLQLPLAPVCPSSQPDGRPALRLRKRKGPALGPA